MRTLFLTSNIGSYYKNEEGIKIACRCNNSNHFIDRLKSFGDVFNNFVVVASNPDDYARTDEYLVLLQKAFDLDGLKINNYHVLDHRFKGDIEKTILSADLVFLSGGHVPTQNKYFKEIGLKEILAKYDEIIIGQSAGSMNMASIVYCPPEEMEDFTDDFERSFEGLGLTDIRIMPHMASLVCDNINGNGKNSVDYCLEDSFEFPTYGIYDYGFIEISDGCATAYGKTVLIKNGEIKQVCEDKENIEVNPKYNI